MLAVLKKEFDAWKGTLRRLIDENPTATEDVIAWKLIEEMGLRGAEMLLPVFERERHLKGRLSMQTNPVNYRNSPSLVEQAIHFNGLAPNIQVKIPATAAGIAAIEEATRLGVNINATVSFTLPQAIAVAEAVESLGASPQTLSNIRRLREGAAAVVTGHKWACSAARCLPSTRL